MIITLRTFGCNICKKEAKVEGEDSGMPVGWVRITIFFEADIDAGSSTTMAHVCKECARLKSENILAALDDVFLKKKD